MIQLAAYHFNTGPTPVTPPGKLYTYVLAGNGVFIAAQRPELEAVALVSETDVRGLPDAAPYANFHLPRVPEAVTRACFNRARSVCVGDAKPREVLFYLIHEERGWRMVEPEQHADGASCRPADPSNEDCARSVIELHSHHEMKAFWSGTDDADETGFKLYAVIGRIFSEPTLRVRAGVYGYFVELPAGDVFELPPDVSGAAFGEGRAEPVKDDGAIVCGDCFAIIAGGEVVRERGAAYCPNCGVRLCRECGCTERAACPEGCSWSENAEVCDAHVGVS